jgi:hypothetical protein
LVLVFVFLELLYFFGKVAYEDPGFIPYQDEDAYEAKNRQFFKSFLIVGGERG